MTKTCITCTSNSLNYICDKCSPYFYNPHISLIDQPRTLVWLSFSLTGVSVVTAISTGTSFFTSNLINYLPQLVDKSLINNGRS